jgi:hypothetical protein
MVKRFWLGFAAALVFGLPAVLTATAPAGAASYPLTCQTGSTNSLMIISGNAFVIFTPSKGPASAGLQPGQCAWADRAVSATEPHMLCLQTTPANLIIRGGTVTNQPDTFSGSGGALAAAAAFGTSKLMTFMVHNNSGGVFGCLAIDTYGP